MFDLINPVRDALNRANERVSKIALKAVRPLYRNIGTKPNHLGTVTFVKVDGADYVLTAAHVIDHHTSHTLFIGHNGLQPVTLTFRTTVGPGGNRTKDRWDFSFAKVDSAWRGAGIEPLDLSNLPALGDTRLFTAVGYPTSANRKYNPTKRTIRPTQRRYASARLAADHPFYKELGVSHATHIAIIRDGRFSMSGGTRVNAFEPRGMSGGIFFGFPISILRQ
jgi:hypothetical protein